ncbi:recombinase family protein [Cerasibacillus sp.]|uniref:recombinase family protein n=1 Tax=Cerasibacillus sp. TaxID=2498711 RepID=UPI0039C8845B
METVYGYKRIINLVNKNGLKTKKGNLFGINSIKTILEKPTYDGFIDVENIKIGMK